MSRKSAGLALVLAGGLSAWTLPAAFAQTTAGAGCGVRCGDLVQVINIPNVPGSRLHVRTEFCTETSPGTCGVICCDTICGTVWNGATGRALVGPIITESNDYAWWLIQWDEGWPFDSTCGAGRTGLSVEGTANGSQCWLTTVERGCCLDDDCDDGDSCTTDTCTGYPNFTCQHVIIGCCTNDNECSACEKCQNNSCVNVQCPSGQHCNNNHGCAPDLACTNNSGCNSCEFCQNNNCVSVSCSPGQQCNGNHGCEPIPGYCESNDWCAACERCDGSNCVNVACAPGRQCNNNHACEAAPGQPVDGGGTPINVRSITVNLNRLWKWDNELQRIRSYGGSVPLDLDQPTYIMTHGWEGDAFVMEPTAKALAAYQPNANILAWDWHEAANPNREPDIPKLKYCEHLLESWTQLLWFPLGLSGDVLYCARSLFHLANCVNPKYDSILTDAMIAGDKALSEGNQLGAELAKYPVLGRELHLIGKSHGGAVLAQVAKKRSVDSLTTLDTPRRCKIDSVKHIDPTATKTVVFYYGDMFPKVGLGGPASRGATNVDLNESLGTFPVHETITKMDGWFPVLMTQPITFGTPQQYRYPEAISFFPTGYFAESVPYAFLPVGPCCFDSDDGSTCDEMPEGSCDALRGTWYGNQVTCSDIQCYGFTQGRASAVAANAGTIPLGTDDPSTLGMLVLSADRFDSASSWVGTQSLLATSADPLNPDNRVILLQEDGEASLFKRILWPASGQVIEFDYMFREPRGDENLTVYVDNRIVYYDHAATSLATGQLTSSGAIYVGNVAGTSSRLTFVLRTDGIPGGSVVLDNIEILGFMPGDYNADTKIDLIDYAAFQRCFRESPLTPECSVFDLDQDQVVDLRDFVILAACISGPVEPADAHCAALPGACCFGDGGCVEIGDPECSAAGGEFLGTEIACGNETCQGACCNGYGYYCYPYLRSHFACLESGGTYQGHGTRCADLTIDCPPTTGACCWMPPYDECSEATPDDCTLYGGQFMGLSVDCDDVCCTSVPPTLIGACCFGDGECRYGCRTSCESSAGVFHGEGSQCAVGLCTGACCDPYGGSCADFGPAQCSELGRDFQGLGTLCASVECSGACCDTYLGYCIDTGPAYCSELDGSFQGLGTNCETDSCPTGACCNGYYGNCFESEPGNCGEPDDTFFGLGSLCSDVSCPTGACCFNAFSCAQLTAGGCGNWGGSFFFGNGTECEDITCPGGACCDGGSCGISLEASCTYGVFHGVGTTCDDVACGGACCFPEHLTPFGDVSVGCSETVTAEDCIGNNGVFHGLGSSCGDADVRCGGACCVSATTCIDQIGPTPCSGTLAGSFQGYGTDCRSENLQCVDPTGACCYFGSCLDNVTGFQCLHQFGVYHGDGSACENVDCSFHPCPGQGDCCTPHRSWGCDDEACCQSVCEVDPLCCFGFPLVTWDDLCVEEASRLCGLGDGAYCSHCPGVETCCNEHRTPGCDDEICCEAVCARDSYCCEVSWDSLCVGHVADLCASPCP